jgi:hypothetical protein
VGDKLQPVIFGGLLAGALSVAPVVNNCCCLWALAGGATAVYFYVDKSPAPMRAGDGALLGVMAGAVGALVYLLVSLPLSLIIGADMVNDILRERDISLPLGGTGVIVASLLAAALALVGLATLGGVIGVALFEKRRGGRDVPPPPPPPTFGGAGSYGAGL